MSLPLIALDSPPWWQDVQGVLLIMAGLGSLITGIIGALNRKALERSISVNEGTVKDVNDRLTVIHENTNGQMARLTTELAAARRQLVDALESRDQLERSIDIRLRAIASAADKTTAPECHELCEYVRSILAETDRLQQDTGRRDRRSTD